MSATEHTCQDMSIQPGPQGECCRQFWEDYWLALSMPPASPHGPLSGDLSDPGLVDHPTPERAAQPVLARGLLHIPEKIDRCNELVTLDNDVAEAIGWASLTQQQRDDIIYDRAAAEGCENCGSIQCSGRCPERD